MAIKHTSLNHGLFYFYRLHEGKLANLSNGFSGLRDYLERVFEKCPEKMFKEGPRSSALKFDLGIKPVRVDAHEICGWAETGLKNYAHFKTNHSKVQLCMLENDFRTIGVEVPIWLNPSDLLSFNIHISDQLYDRLFGGGNVLTGHIDALALDNHQVWVWDYKPNAHKEKYACTQVFFYALMLSMRSGVPLEQFRCGYFDEKLAYLFKPELSTIRMTSLM